MTDDAWRPLTWKDPEFLEFVDRYSSERLNDIVRHAGVQPNERDVFLTRVVTIAYTLMMEIRELGATLTGKQRSDLKALSKVLEAASPRAAELDAAILDVITIQVKIDIALASGVKLDEPIDWLGLQDGEYRFRTPGRPIDPEESQTWARTGIGRLLTSGNDQYVQDAVQDAINRLIALCRWTSAASKSNPIRKRGRPEEVVLRRGIRRLLRIWPKDPEIPAATSRGPFSRFVDLAFRPALRGYWPDQRGFETAIDDAITGRKTPPQT